MSLNGILRTVEGGILGFWCPGCDGMHYVDGGWTFDGNYDKPTFAPSVLVRSGHYAGPGDCWCTYNAAQVAKGEAPAPFVCTICHSFVRAGRIEFLTDCTHKLAGQTVDLPPPPRTKEE